jgi:hypothetical protein
MAAMDGISLLWLPKGFGSEQLPNSPTGIVSLPARTQ